MAVEKELPVDRVLPMFMQECPLCGRSNRMTVLGVYRDHERVEKYPDMGYSFCNCKCIFYTNWDNLIGDKSKLTANAVKRMELQFNLWNSGDAYELILVDPFFCQWGQNPYEFLHWNPREHWIIWDMQQFKEEMIAIGYNVLRCYRDADVHTKTPQTFHIVLQKP